MTGVSHHLLEIPWVEWPSLNKDSQCGGLLGLYVAWHICAGPIFLVLPWQ